MNDPWVVTTLRDVLIEYRGGYWGDDAPSDRGDVEARVIRNVDIASDGTLRGYATRFLSARERASAAVNVGDVVLSSSGEVGKIWLADRDGYTATNFVRILRPDRDQLAHGYLELLMHSPVVRRSVAEHTSGSAIQNLRSGFLDVEIGLPPLTEQRRIVHLLCGVSDAKRRALELAQLAHRAASAVLHEAFDGADNFISLGSAAVVKGGKRMPKGVQWANQATAHPYIRVVDLKGGRIRTDGLVHVPDKVWPAIRNYVVATGDVVISIVGTIGEVAQVPEALAGANLTENAAVIRPGPTLRPEFLTAYLRARPGREEIARLTVGTTQPKLALFRIKDIQVPMMSLARQAATVSAYESLRDVAFSAEAESASLSALRAAMLGSLLEGQHSIPSSYDRIITDAA